MENQEPKVKKVLNLKTFLINREISQRNLAERTFLSPNTINKLVNKGTASPSVLKLIAYELGITMQEMKTMLEWKEIEI